MPLTDAQLGLATKRAAVALACCAGLLLVGSTALTTGIQQQRPEVATALNLTVDDAFEAAHHSRRFADLPPVSLGAAAGQHKLLRLGSTPVLRRGAAVGVLAPAMPRVLVLPKQGAENGTDAGTSVHVDKEGEGKYRLHLAPDAAVGWYRLEARNESLDFVVLFNPWLQGTQEYVDDASRAEHVERDDGVAFQGAASHPGGTKWLYDQWRGSNLLSAVAMLDGLDDNSRRDAALLTRHLVHHIREHVCDGKWGGGEYTTGCVSGDGTPGYCCANGEASDQWPRVCHEPGTITTSTGLLEQHTALKALFPDGGVAQHGARWCQCWVFGALAQTVHRSLGLAIRQTTAFNSADPGEDRAVSHFFLRSGPGKPLVPVQADALCPAWCTGDASEHLEEAAACDLQACHMEVVTGLGFAENPACEPCVPCIPCVAKRQMVWNFHNWNEVWLSRSQEIVAEPHGDRAVSRSGWNVVDATYKVGPADKASVLRGQDACFDAKFVIGETNAWEKMYVYELDGLNASAVRDTVGLADALEGKAKVNRTKGDPLFLGTRFAGSPFGHNAQAIGALIATHRGGPVSQACAEAGYCAADLEDITLTYKPHQPSPPHGADLDSKQVCARSDSRAVSGRRLSPQLDAPLGRPQTRVAFTLTQPEAVELGQPFSVELAVRAPEPADAEVLVLLRPVDYRGTRLAQGDRFVSLPVAGEKTEYRARIQANGAPLRLSLQVDAEQLGTRGGTPAHVLELVVSAASLGETFVARPRLRVEWPKDVVV